MHNNPLNEKFERKKNVRTVCSWHEAVCYAVTVYQTSTGSFERKADTGFTVSVKLISQISILHQTR